MVNWNHLKDLHSVKQIKDIIHSWWGVDLLIIDGKDIAPIPDDFNQTLRFNNPLIKKLFTNTKVQKSVLNTLNIIQKQEVHNVPGFLEKWHNTGLSLFIVPIQSYDQVTGFVVAAGFLYAEKNDSVEDLKQKWVDNLESSKTWWSENKQYIPIVPARDNNHFIDLLKKTAKEISAVQQELINKSQTLKNISVSHNLSYGKIVGKSKIMHQLYNLLDKIKHSHNTILIQGENGTGKELIAHSIHQNSSRNKQPFIAQNCSALNDNLLESELFGHVKGAFTGAYKDKKGLIELADNGTFFLDEVGDTSPTMQVKILRVIQEGTFYPVGGTQPKKVDIRIISATNKNLKKMIEDGTFREDLYYRLNVINIQVPPLRDRIEDIDLLAEFFMSQFSSQVKIFTNAALEKIKQYPWPGNIRELQNEIERLAVLTGKDTYIKTEILSEKIRNKEASSQLISFLNPNNSKKIMKKAIAQLERQMISQSLKQEGWNKTKVAQKLGISRAALISKVKTYKIEKRPIKHELTLNKKTNI